MTDKTAALHAHNGLHYPWPSAPPRGEWQEVADGVVWLRMPLPFGLDHINLYLLRHGDGWVIVDTGLGDQPTRDVWLRVFDEVFEGRPVKAVIATHFHYDHSGSLGWLAEYFKCPVLMTRAEYHSLFMDMSGVVEPGWDFYQFFERCGIPEQRVADFLKIIKGGAFERKVPASYVRLIDKQVLKIGERDWEVVVGAGHSPEHACLLSRKDGLFISGDQVLPRITSSIAVMVSEPEANPLDDWLESIKSLQDVPDDVLVLPAHERPFYGLHRRLDQLAAHHQVLLGKLTDWLNAEKTADDATQFLFPHVTSSFDLLMAGAETLAHLNYLLRDKRAVRRLDSGRYWYRRRQCDDVKDDGAAMLQV